MSLSTHTTLRWQMTLTRTRAATLDWELELELVQTAMPSNWIHIIHLHHHHHHHHYRHHHMYTRFVVIPMGDNLSS